MSGFRRQEFPPTPIRLPFIPQPARRLVYSGEFRGQ
jgi:hypothetical protein